MFIYKEASNLSNYYLYSMDGQTALRLKEHINGDEIPGRTFGLKTLYFDCHYDILCDFSDNNSENKLHIPKTKISPGPLPQPMPHGKVFQTLCLVK